MASSNPILGEIRLMACDQAPGGWAVCDGRLVSVAQFPHLYSLLGVTYGGDGRSSFGLPDLRGRIPVQINPLHAQASRFGVERHRLVRDEMPAHDHTLYAEAKDGESADPGEHLPARTPGAAYFEPLQEPRAMGPAVGSAGGDQGHENMMPFIVLNYCIALQGDWPERTDTAD